MTDESQINAEHNKAMKALKAERDEMMKEKTVREKGLIIVHTGNGKGKSSSAFGMIMRCIAHGMPCGVVQFIKGNWITGRKAVPARTVRRGVQIRRLGRGLHLGHAGPGGRYRRRPPWLGGGQGDDPRAGDEARRTG
jgi:ATP:corrinoid adenosyltransferase